MPRIFAFVCISCGLMVCQNTAAPPKASPGPTAPAKARPKLPPKSQHALELLENARSESGAFQADMRAFILCHAAQGVDKIDKRKSRSWLADAFRASQSVEERNADTEECGMDEVCHVKRFLQLEILQQIASRDAAQAERLLPYADTEVKNQITATLVTRFTNEKNLARAEALLSGLADSEGYPYAAAIQLMDAQPSDAEKLTIFNQALTNFRQNSGKTLDLRDDFGEMVSRFYEKLPPSVTIEAIDTLLDAAKEQDKENQMHVSFSTTQGKAASFDSAYQMRLFEVLPILQQLDPSRAEDLLKENTALRPMMAEYPKGLGSIRPHRDRGASSEQEAGSGFFSTSYSSGSVSGTQTAAMRARVQAQAQITRQMNQVSKELASDPKQALSDALNMPLAGADPIMMSPRVQALMKVARATVAAHPEIAKSALDEIQKASENMDSGKRGRLLIEVVELYVRLGRREQARNTLLEVTKAAEQLYKKDSDANDPNLAFKGVWPSTGLWMKCVQVADSISPYLAEELIANISDLEIASYQRVTYANSLLGVPNSSEMAEQHKGGGSTITSF